MQEQDGDGEPAHHARRPMNAFLIFCKRHRSVVREKYPNLENRSITKILGEWWANLEKEEKASYTGLAKQYKDAFFHANPDFKWYKLPAPPLRSLAGRREPPRPAGLPPDPPDLPDRPTNNNTKVHLNRNAPQPDAKYSPPLSMFTPGKLADEANMGGLSSLLTKTDPNYPTLAISADHTQADKSRNPEQNIQELQDALSETSKMFEDEFDDANDAFTNQDVIDHIVDKRYSKDEENNWADDKSGRSCKGKRYQEFMAHGGLIVSKRQKRDYNDRTPDDEYATYGWEPGTSCDEATVTDDTKQSTSHDTSAEHDAEALDATESANKSYKPADFDLDAKIRALPSLSLEKFQQKKRENKRRKKSLKPKTFESSQIINSVPYYDVGFTSWRETVTGSQKRKPRKVSITRLEINSMVSSEKTSPEIKLATEAPCTVVQNMEFCKQPTHDSVDLLALATLAEVAANTSRIEHTIINVPANGNDENASTV